MKIILLLLIFFKMKYIKFYLINKIIIYLNRKFHIQIILRGIYPPILKISA